MQHIKSKKYLKGGVMDRCSDKKIEIFWGNEQSCPVAYLSPEFSVYCQSLCEKFTIKKIIIQKQVHGVVGDFIYSDSVSNDLCSLYQKEGDYLITDQVGIGIGVLTADCLPIVFYDKKNSVIAITHAGWRSSVGEIVIKTLERMLLAHKFSPRDIWVYFGPCAKSCCYEVNGDFIENIKKYFFYPKLIRQDGEKIFFDLPLLNKFQLIEFGVDPTHINLDNNVCTMCRNGFYSYRRDGEMGKRQLSLVWLPKED